MRTGPSWLAMLVVLLVAIVAGAAVGPVATVGTEQITRTDFETTMEDLAGQKVLLHLIDEALILQTGAAAGVLVSEEAAAEELGRVARAFSNSDEFQSALTGAGLDRSALVRRIRADLTLENLAMRDFQVPEEELVQHYGKYREAFGRPAVLRARHLAVATEAEALALRAQLDRRADFSALARTHSLDTSTRDRGGDMGELALSRLYARGMISLTGEPFPPNVNGLDVMGPTTDRLQLWQYAHTAAREAAAADLVGPIKTVHGWSLLQLVEWQEGSAPSFLTARELVRSHLFRTRYPLRLDLMRWELRQRAKVQIRRSRYEALTSPVGKLRWSVDPNLVDPLHPSLLNLRVYGLQDVLRLYLVGDLMQDFDSLRLTTKNHAYASRMAAAGSMSLRMDRAIDEVALQRVGDDGWSKIYAEARIRYREGTTAWTSTVKLTADVLSSPDGYRWKVVDSSPPERHTSKEEKK